MSNSQNYIQLNDGYLILDSQKQGLGTGVTRGLKINIGGITQLIFPPDITLTGHGNGLLGIENDGTVFFSTGGGGGGGSPTGPAGGDLGLSYPNPTVTGLQGRALLSTAPGANQVISFNGTQWAPSNVLAIQGFPIAITAPTSNQVLEWNGSAWAPANLPSSLPPSGAAGGDLSGSYPNPTVATAGGNTIITNASSAGGDLSGTYPNPAVVKLQGFAVSNTSPTSGYVLEWSGTAWTPTALPSSSTPSGPAGGDLSGTYPNPTVAKVNGTSVPSGPSANRVLVATSSSTAVWSQIVDGYVAAGAAIAYSKLALSNSIVNADVNTSAAIAYSKLALSNSIVNADVNTAAAIAGTKIAPNFGSQNILTSGTLGAGAATLTSITDSGLSTGVVHSDSGGLFTSSLVVNADVSGSAAIAYSKLALSNSIVNADINTAAAIAYSKLALSNSIVNADINSSAAIVYSKLSLSNSIVNADINSAAAIAYSKLALSNSIVNADVNTAAAIAYTKLALTGSIVNADVNASAAIAYSKLNLSASIVNADVNTAAAIAVSKLAAGTAAQILQNNGTPTWTTVGGDITIGNTGSVTLQNLRGKSLDISLASVGASQDGYSLTWDNADGYWRAYPPPVGFTAGGDLSGTSTNQTVIGIQTVPVANTAPTDQFVLTYDSGLGKWKPAAAAGGSPTGAAGGDLSGTYPNPVVAQIQTKPLSSALASIGASQDGYILSWDNTDGYWNAVPASSIIVDAQNFSFSNSSSDIGGYFKLLDFASGSEGDLTAVVNANTVLIKSFASTLGSPEIQLIPAGLWEFNFYAYADLTGAFTTTVKFEVYTRTAGGSETLLFTATSANIQVTSVGLYTLLYNYSSDTTVLPTDRIVIKVYGSTTNVLNTTVHFVFDGTTHASLVRTPISGDALQLGGDLSGTTAVATVLAINGTTVPATPSANQVLVATSGTASTWQQIANAQVSGSAAIAYSKLNLTGSIVNADVNASAAIAYSKLNITGSIVNADVNASAAIAYSKLALTGSIVNADVNASAAIAYTKLALTNSIVNADIAAAAAIAYSKLNLTGNIVNADINASAAVAVSKLAAGTANQVLINSATPTPAWTTLSGDVTNVLGVMTVNAISGSTPIVITPAELQWKNTTSSPLIDQAALASTSGASGSAGTNLSVKAQAGQAATGAAHNGGAGGNLILAAGAGGTSGSATAGVPGNITLQTGATADIIVSAPTPSLLLFDFQDVGTIAIEQVTKSGTGANNGNNMSITSQGGQAQSGGSNNNNGGNLTLTPGLAGTGGGGTAGTGGHLILTTGASTSEIDISDSGIALPQLLNAAFLQTNGSGIISAGTTIVATVGTIDSQTKSANGVVISGSSIYEQTADATHPGLVSTGTQSWAGDKTLSGATTLSALGTGIVHSGSGGALTSSLIVNADVSASAAIVYSKLSLTGGIVDADVNASAAIAGSKVSPAFGAQNISTTGSLTAGSTSTKNTLLGGMVASTFSVSGNLTLGDGYYIVLIDTSGARTITLPTPVNGQVFILKDKTGGANTNNITLARHASEKIEGIAASRALSTAWGQWAITTDGTDWFVIGQ